VFGLIIKFLFESIVDIFIAFFAREHAFGGREE
jgi:hypothetical protein